MIRPQYLYHYTTIETLELILKNKTIRFNSLENVDDLSEQLTRDAGNFGKHCFVSCWTYDSQQSITLWDLYSKQGKGVRIQLSFDPFLRYDHDEIIYSLYHDGKVMKQKTGNVYQTIFPEDSYGKNYFLNDLKDKFFSNITYTTDKSLLYPCVESFERNKLSIDNIGIYKHPIWDTQKECRYRFIVFPIKDITYSILHPEELYSGIKKGIDLPFTHYDLKIKDASFMEMKILTGYDNTKEDIEKIVKLVEKYNPSATIVPNELTGQIKSK